MNRLTLSCLVAAQLSTVSARAAHADDPPARPIRIDVGVVGAYGSGSGRAGGGGMLEAKVLPAAHFAVGVRTEGIVLFGGKINAGGDVKMSIGAVGALLAKGEYYVATGDIRPVLGLGVGVYDIVSQSISAANTGTASIDQRAGRFFGLAPEIALDLDPVRLAVAYNAILGADIQVHQQVGTTQQTTSYSQNYFMFELSIRLGNKSGLR